MRIERLQLETPGETVELALHPLLTVVTGLGRLEREALTSEILGALGTGRPGLNIDLIGPDGKFIQVRRPLQGHPTVTDGINGADLTLEYLRGGSVDLLSRVGLDRGQARTLLRIGRSDVRVPVGKQVVIEQLAEVDQGILWGTAKRLAEIDVELDQMVNQKKLAPEEIKDIEQQWAEREQAEDSLEATPVIPLAGAGVAAVGAIMAAIFVHLLLVIPFALVAAGAIGYHFDHQRRARQVTLSDALSSESAGGSSYLGYQMEQATELTEGRDASRRLELNEERRLMAARWDALTGGDVTLAWAVEHRPDILQAAQSVNVPESPTDHLPDILPRMDDGQLGVVEAMLQRVGQLSVLFPAGMTMVLDDPLSDLDDFELTAALHKVDEAMTSHQMVLMSDDPRIVGWAHRMSEINRASLLHLGGTAEPVDIPAPAPRPRLDLVNA